MEALIAKSLTVKVGEKILLNQVDFTVQPGQVTAVVGPNGAGKTSLLKSLSGELNNYCGGISLQGRSLRLWTEAERAQLLSVLPQQSALNFPFLVEEVVALGRYPHATGRERDQQIITEVSHIADIVHLCGRDYTTLSGGEKQRVHLARVLAQIWEPTDTGERYLLLDEPTAALDLAHQHRVLESAGLMAQQGVGVLVILHDLNLAAQYADKVVMLHNGKVVANGGMEEVLTEQNIAQVFGVAISVMSHPLTGKPLVIYNSPGDVAKGPGR